MSLALEVRSIQNVECILQDDDADAPPHLFVDSDSVCSSITGLSSAVPGSQVDSVQIPHVFLSYAEPPSLNAEDGHPSHADPAAECHSRTRNLSRTRCVNHVGASPLDDQYNASAPHMFLPYASKGYHDLLSRIERQERNRVGHLLSHDILQFESKCLHAFRKDHELGPTQSAVAAKAIGKAVEQTATMHTKHKDRISFFDKAFKKAMEDSPDMHNNASSMNGVREEAQEELNFLRNCVRELVLRLGDSPSVDLPTPHNRTAQHVDRTRYDDYIPGLDDPIDFGLEDPVDLALEQQIQPKSRQQPANSGFLHDIMQAPGVPDRIEIPARGNNDGSDVVSLLTPFDEPFMRCRLPSSDDVDPVEFRSPAIKPFVPVSGFSVSDLGASKETDLPAATRYIETVQLLMKCRPGRPSRKLLMHESEPMPVQATRFRLQMTIMGVTFTGCYNGGLLRGIPHGPGVFRFDNRDLYVGNFECGMMHGEGTLFCRKKLCTENSKLVVLRGRFVCNEFKGGPPQDDATSAGAA